jgi:hypothetical protein
MKIDNSIIVSLISSAAVLGSAWIGKPPKPRQPINIYVEPPQPLYVYFMDWLDQVS